MTGLGLTHVPEPKVLPTKESLIEEAKRLISEGYRALPYDFPPLGLRGVSLFKEVEGFEHNTLLVWEIHGKTFDPSEFEVSPEELLEFSNNGPVELSDDPMRFKLGFIRYDIESGKSYTFKTSVRKLKEADQDVRVRILERRAELLRNPSSLEWYREAFAP